MTNGRSNLLIHRRFCLLALIWLLAGGEARAAMIAEDDFEAYPSGSIDERNGGSGWAREWEGRRESIESIVDTSGNEMLYRAASGEAVRGSDRALAIFGNHDLAAFRETAQRISTRNVFVSMLVRFTGTQNINDFLALWFEEEQFGAAPNIGIKMEDGSGATENDFFVRTQANNHVSVENIVEGATYFIVGHLSKPDNDPDSEYDVFRLWVNPVSLRVQPAEDAVSRGRNNIAEIRRIGFRSANLDRDDQVEIDRLRLGTTWADVTEPDVVPVLELRMDERSWTGAVGEVADFWSGLNGTAFDGPTTSGTNPAIPGTVGTCRYGEFDGRNDHVIVPHDPVLNGATTLTYMAWVRPNAWNGIRQIMAKSVHGGGAGRAQMGIFSEGGVLKVRAETDRGRQEAAAALPPTGVWSHVAGVFTRTRLALYVDGALVGSVTYSPSTLIQTSDPLAISKRVGTDQYFFDGAIDEVRVFAEALDGRQIRAAMNDTRQCDVAPVTTASALAIGHDGTGIHCLDETISVAALDDLGAVFQNYAGEVALSTSTGRGTWRLVSGNGTLLDAVADDGAAVYQFATADAGVARFSLSYPEGASPVDVDAVDSADGAVRDDDSEGPLAFAPSGFTLTAGALSNPPPSPIADPVGSQRAGVAFPVHLTAYGVTEDDPLCGVIESYAGRRDLAFAMTYVNPSSGAGLTATVDGLAAGGPAQPVAFASGRASVSARYDDAGSIRLQVTDAASFGHALTGASNDFVVQPYELRVTRVQTPAGIDNPAPAAYADDAFLAAGLPFEVDVEAVDADGDRTPNFGRETPAEGVRVTSDVLVAPAGGRNGSSGDVIDGAAFGPTGVPGRFENDRVVFDEVGIIRLRPAVADGDYLGSGAVPGVATGNVGRFHPAGFDVTGDAVAAACGAFTYMDQPALGVRYRLQALNALGGVVENYDAGLLGAGLVAAAGLAAEAGDDGVDRGGRITPPGGVWSAGEIDVDRIDLAFGRVAAPDGPFDPLSVSLRVTDPLGDATLAGLDSHPATTGDCSVAGNCTTRALGAPTRVVYGRLVVLPAAGPENENLTVPLAAQQFTGAAFESHPADVCTTYRAGDVTLAGFTANLAAGETAAIAPVAATALIGGAGDPARPLTLSAPGFGNEGTVDVTLDVPGWLEFDWQGTGLEDPAGTAAFGRFRGHDRVIYWGEPP